MNDVFNNITAEILIGICVGLAPVVMFTAWFALLKYLTKD